MIVIRYVLTLLFFAAGGILFIGTLIAGLAALSTNAVTPTHNLLAVHLAMLFLFTGYLLSEDL